MLVSMKDMLQHALKNGYAVGQFNINNLEMGRRRIKHRPAVPLTGYFGRVRRHG